MVRKLTPKQRKFANEFIKTNNAYQSAINAGYAKGTARNATKQLLENTGIHEYIIKKTGNVEKRESDEADEVLKNIYRISAGKEIERHYVKIDNLAKEAVGGDDSIEARMEYMTDETTITPASTKEQVAAAELWFKLSGRLKNDSKDVEDQKIRKLKADADIAEAKARIMNASTDSTEAKVSEYLDKLDDALGGDSDGN
ncbi:terminase small subunit [Lactiplantibacillus plantarum]|uniref:terminase small subunit n=1 Tax=Lactiplantibacillus plantarum TaxID=1590 RepID=UPI0007A5CF3C|nr:terminase small subunit [Lactiplantibacillus plantarum]AMX10917.1 terminase [Lactiplantibacillus plantarum]KZT88759.1 phage terminase small subunit [Lactiplantibacillus plantarum]MDN7015045.1 terminase small subunit [Lactiplantibacillus plantarum]MDN7049037.1 terminase small subunit [Lactiplantibacillus plantarum]MDN7052121.1 terminase small subunit [Lactiplantibacillus plantarum]